MTPAHAPTIRIESVIWLSGHVSYQVWCDGRKVGTRRTIAEAQALVEELRAAEASSKLTVEEV